MLHNPPHEAEPRASRIAVPGRVDLTTELWMGGAYSLHGDLLRPEDFAGAWVIDVAGDLSPSQQAACALWLPCVFSDFEEVPPVYSRLTRLARSIAACLIGAEADDGWEHPTTPPRRIYLLCNQGLNRSGLVTGLILRALGVPAEDTLAAIAARPGSLSNRTFARLVREWIASNEQRATSNE
jgi:hypothetical protein